MHKVDMSEQIKHWFLYVVFSCSLGAFFTAHAEGKIETSTPLVLPYKVVRALPHDTAHFTQGLIFSDGKIFESVGLYGKSAVIEKDAASGKVLHAYANTAQTFAEGLTRLGDRFYQITWKEQTAYVYDTKLRLVDQRHYAGDGWGLATLSTAPAQLIMSDGSAKLSVRDPKDFHVIRTINVHAGAHEIPLLNELEVVDGLVFANLWMTDVVAVIAPDDGRVVAWLDLSALKASFEKPVGWNAQEHVLNGIAYDAASDHFYITGKCWPVMFELQIDRSILKRVLLPAPSP